MCGPIREQHILSCQIVEPNLKAQTGADKMWRVANVLIAGAFLLVAFKPAFAEDAADSHETALRYDEGDFKDKVPKNNHFVMFFAPWLVSFNFAFIMLAQTLFFYLFVFFLFFCNPVL